MRFFLFFYFLFLPSLAHAGLIRDAEVEHTLRTFTNPILEAAGLNPEAVKIFIVQDDSLNAYVAGGANIFIHTGLIQAASSPDMLVGVIAHETGHIAGGHLARGTEQLKNAQMGTILSYVLGAAIAAGSGHPEAGVAVISGGGNALLRNHLSYTRANEQSADQAATEYLDKLNISANGLLQMFEQLRRKENRRFGTPDPYLLTHPLGMDRIAHMRSHLESSAIPEGQYPKEWNALHQRMQAKLFSFIELPPKTFAKYPESKSDISARMARAVAWYKVPDAAKAISIMDALTRDYPKDAYLFDLAGQIYFENGKIKEALAAYQKAAALVPDSPMILTALGETQLAIEQPAMLVAAIASLEKSSRLDNSYNRTWRLLATAYGKHKDMGLSRLALAEEALLAYKPEVGIKEAEGALSLLPEGSPARLRAEDLKRQALEMKRQKEQDS